MYDLMLAEVHQACREPREVGDGVEEDLGGLAVQLGPLEDDKHLLVQLRADGDWRCRTCRSC